MRADGPLARLRAVAVPPEDRPGRRRALRLAGLAVIAGFALLAARQVDVGRVLAAVAGASPLLVLAAAGANVLSLAAHSMRWASVVRLPAGGRPRFRDAFAAVVSGFAVGIVVPARAGDLVRAAVLARRARVPVASVLTAAALDYVVGAAAIVPLLALLALAMPLPAWARSALLFFAVAAGGGAALVFLLRPRRGAAPPAAHEAAGLARRLRGGLAAVHEPRALSTAFAWALAGWGAELLIAVAALGAVGLPASVPAGALAVVASTAANVVAVSPGNAGPFELGVTLALVGLGAGREAALAFALVYHLVHLAPVGLLGLVALTREARLRARELPRAPAAGP